MEIERKGVAIIKQPGGLLALKCQHGGERTVFNLVDGSGDKLVVSRVTPKKTHDKLLFESDLNLHRISVVDKSRVFEVNYTNPMRKSQIALFLNPTDPDSPVKPMHVLGEKIDDETIKSASENQVVFNRFPANDKRISAYERALKWQERNKQNKG